MTALALVFACSLPAQEAAQARQLARAAGLYTEYLGRRPDSLEALTRRPADAKFWPDTGFWLGAIPAGASLKDGVVRLGAASENVPAPRGAVVPPTDRLRQYYSARVGIALLRLAVEAQRELRGAWPARPEDLGPIPKDPWGKPYLVQFVKNRVRISVDGGRNLSPADLTPDETAALDRDAVPVLSAETRKAIPALLEALRDDDLEPREEAVRKLRALGPVVRPFVQEALRREKDPDLLSRLGRLAALFPERAPAWREQLRPLATVIVPEGPQARAAAASCSNNLSQLWKMQHIYMSQFGGRMKLMPRETGKDFWLKLTKTTPPLIDDTVLEIFICPLSGVEPKAGVCSYAGPAQEVQKIPDGGVVGMCDDEGHGDQVILLRKSGDVTEVARDGPEHEEAKKATRR